MDKLTQVNGTLADLEQVSETLGLFLLNMESSRAPNGVYVYRSFNSDDEVTREL